MGLGNNATGTKLSVPSIATLGAVACIAIGLPLRCAILTQLRNRFALRPRARATWPATIRTSVTTITIAGALPYLTSY